MKNTTTFLLSVFLLTACTSIQPPQEKKSLPNIIYILADDMGYGDISALNEHAAFTTPNLDTLSSLGMYFTDAHSGSAVCTPTRYGILTGRYAWRTSLQNGVSWSWSEPLIDKNRTTVASLLKKHSYQTACIGKWHLGLGWQKDSSGIVDIRLPLTEGPNDNGFDYFFGITASLDIPPYIYLENDRSTTTEIDTIEKNDGKGFWRRGPIGADLTHEDVLPTFTKKAVEYIEQASENPNPFFLYFPLPAPHTPILPTEAFRGKSNTNEYGDFVLMVDDVVGQIMQKLREKRISENTMIIFTSDNGCSPMADFEELEGYGHDPSYIFRGHKADIFEGGHRVPFIASWPKKIKAGSNSDEIVCLTDLMATCAAITGDTLEDKEGEDSYNILPVLMGESADQPLREATVHHSINGSFSIRQGKWKLSFCPGSGGWSNPRPKEAKVQNLPPIQLYDVSSDPAETNNLASEKPEVVNRLSKLMHSYIENGRSTAGEAQENDVEVTMNK